MFKTILSVAILATSPTILHPGVATQVAPNLLQDGSVAVSDESYTAIPTFDDIFPGEKIQKERALEKERLLEEEREIEKQRVLEQGRAEAARLAQERAEAEQVLREQEEAEAARLAQEQAEAEAQEEAQLAQVEISEPSVPAYSAPQSGFMIETTAYSINASVPYDGRILTATGYEVSSPYYSHPVYGALRIVAVDPSFIPLGSILNIEGIGLAIALDTGGVVHGNIVDIMFQSEEECIQYGRRTISASVVE